MTNYIILRYGLSTGTCAAAAAKAAALAAQSTIVDRVVVPTPIGLRVEVPVKYAKKLKDQAGEACVVKDSGDDRENDVTHGLHIVARVELKAGRNIEVRGGRGVGVVTQPGLPIPPGEYAINPVPRRQIENAVKEVLPEALGAIIEISIPGGDKISSKTLNPELGIVEGLSILGTTGFVEPYSCRAFIQTIALQLNLLLNLKVHFPIVTSGRTTKRWLVENCRIPANRIIEAGDYIVKALEVAHSMGFKKAVLVSKPAKILKLSVGAVNTNSAFVDARLEALVFHALKAGVGFKELSELANARSVAQGLLLLKKGQLEKVLKHVALEAERKIQRRFHGMKLAAAVLYRNTLYGTPNFSEIFNEALQDASKSCHSRAWT